MQTIIKVGISIFLLPAISIAQVKNKAVDYLNVAGPLAFNNASYLLAWSSHPSDSYYKQEYLVKGETPEKFKSMLMLEVVTGNQDIKGIVGAKVSELKKIKETNPMANYDMIQNPNTGEYILDFLLTANSPTGDISIIEWNVYRYRVFKDVNGKKGIQLFAYSTRGYAPGVDTFLASFKTKRKELVNAVAQYKVPEVKILP